MNRIMGLAVLLACCQGVSMAQAAEAASGWQLSGYLEAYYLRDFNQPDSEKRPAFTYSHNLANRPAINLAMAKLNFTDERLRVNLGLGSGSYMRANYVLEPDYFQHLYEANIGMKLSSQHQLWLDVGLMPSHIGFESAVGIDNWTMTRSMMADNSPYFETGAKLSYSSDDGKWLVSGLLLNGWQRVRAPQGNTTPSIGHLLSYKPNDRLTLNSSSFIGNDKSDQARQMRYFHHFDAQFVLSDRWALITALDLGAEQAAPQSSDYNVWYTPVVIARYLASDRCSIATRLEYYRDKHGVIVATGTPNGFDTWGYSVNLDYRLEPRVVLRTELRALDSRNAIFETGQAQSRSTNLMLGTAVTFSF